MEEQLEGSIITEVQVKEQTEERTEPTTTMPTSRPTSRQGVPIGWLLLGLVIFIVAIVALIAIVPKSKKVKKSTPAPVTVLQQQPVNQDSIQLLKMGYSPLDAMSSWPDSATITLPHGLAILSFPGISTHMPVERINFATSGQRQRVWARRGRYTALVKMKDRDTWVTKTARFTVSAIPMAGEYWEDPWTRWPSYGWVEAKLDPK